MTNNSRNPGGFSAFATMLDTTLTLRLVVCACLFFVTAILMLNAFDLVICGGYHRIAPIQWLADHIGIWSKHPPRLEVRGEAGPGVDVSPGPATRLYGAVELSFAALAGGVMIAAGSRQFRKFGMLMAVAGLVAGMLLTIVTVVVSVIA